jgi:hypothetical protein
LTGVAAAADEPKDAPKPGARVSVNKERVKCRPAGPDDKAIIAGASGELGGGSCEGGSKTQVVVEQDFSVKLEIKQKPTGACVATVDFEYQQRNTVAHVIGAIENTQCAASSGDYVLAVTVRDANGEVTTLEFPQEWARNDAESVKLTYDLPIGPNVDLTNVRTRRLRCTCTEPAEKP